MKRQVYGNGVVPIVKNWKLSRLGHLLRLDEETPVKKALAEYLGKVKRCAEEENLLDWHNQSDFQYLNVNDETKLLQHLNVLSGDKKLWKTLTQHMMLNTTVM